MSWRLYAINGGRRSWAQGNGHSVELGTCETGAALHVDVARGKETAIIPVDIVAELLRRAGFTVTKTT